MFWYKGPLKSYNSKWNKHTGSMTSTDNSTFMPNWFFYKGVKQFKGRKIIFSSNDANNWTFTGKKKNLNITHYSKTNSKLSMHVHVKHSYTTFELPWWLSGKEFVCQCRRCRVDPWVRKIPCRRKWQPTPVFLPGQSHGQRSLEAYSPWGQKELDTTERLSNSFLIYLLMQIIWSRDKEPKLQRNGAGCP